MLEVGLFHNGATDLPLKRTATGMVLPTGTLADMHASNQRIVQQPGQAGHAGREAGIRILLDDRAPLPAGRVPSSARTR